MGYIFGEDYRSSGVTQIRQYYHGNSTTNTTSSYYYFPQTLTDVTVTGGEILYGAFYNCSRLTNVVIPNVEKIGDYAFYSCGALVSIAIPSTVKTLGKNVFYDCSAFKEIVLPEGVETIGSNAFYGCDSLTEVTLPSTLKTIDAYAFYSCPAIVKVNIVSITVFMNVTVASSNEHLLRNALLYVDETPVTEIAIPEGSQTVGNAFANYAGLEKIVIPDSVTEISAGAFSGCKNLTSVTLGGGVQTLGDNAFAGCSSLATLTLPDSVTTVGAAAFKGSGLQSIDLSNVSTLGENALQNCASLENVALCPTLTELPAYVFGGCTSLIEIIIPSSVTVIGNYAFQNCTFTVIVIPDSVTSVGTQIFNGCNALESVTMPFIGKNATDTTTFGQHFGRYTDDYPTALKNVTITAPTATTVSGGAFAYLTGLKNVYIDMSGGNVTFAYSVMSNCSAILHLNLNDLADWFNLTFSSYSYNPIANGGILTVQGEPLPQVWTLPENITIGKYQFYGLTGIEKIIIPDGVTEIGEYAFSGAKINEIVLPETLETIGDYDFQNAQFKNFTIPNSVTAVSSTALDGCTALEYVYIGDGLMGAMPAKLFADCTSLVELNLPEAGTKTTLNSSYTGTYFIALFNETNSSSSVGTATWQDSYTTSRYTYYYRAQLPETLKKVTVRGGEISASNTLKNLSLETLVLGENVTVSNTPLSEIGSVENLILPQAAFEGYKSIVKAAIKNLTFNQYDGAAFVSNLSGLISLETLNLPDGVTEFSPEYFYNTPYSLIVNFSENDRYVFDQGNIIDLTTNTVIVGFDAATMPEYVTAIGENAYANRLGITELCIPDTLETVAETAFTGCSITVLSAPADKIDAVNAKLLVKLHIISGDTLPEMSNFTALEELIIDGNFTALPENFLKAHTKIKTVVTNDCITEIGAYAFDGCTALENVTLSKELVTLGNSAFNNCVKLTSFTLPEKLTALPHGAFNNCKNLQTLVWNDVLQSVGSYAVYGTKVKEIALPNTVTSIETYSFANNSALATFVLSNQLTTLPAYFLSNTAVTDLVLPDSVTSVETDAFSNLKLKNLTIGKGFQTIPESFISNQATLQTVILPEGLVSIGANAFSDCTALKNVQLPDTLVEIGENAFTNCSALAEISLPTSLTAIGENAFQGASKLTAVEIPSVEAWLSIKFANAAASPAYNNASLLLSGEAITELIIPESVTEIRDFAFCCVVSITDVDLANVETIGRHAFAGTNLTELDLNNVKTIGNYAFTNSTVSAVNFRNVETIGTHAFYNTALTEARLPDTLTSLGTYAFAYCKDLTVFDTGDGLTKMEDSVILKNYSATSVKYQPFTSIRLGKNVGKLSFHAFDGIKTETLYFDATSCSKYDTYSVSFKSATIGNLIFGENVKNIGYYLFYTEAVQSSVSWVSPTITSIEFKGESINSIGKYAFAYVKGLKSLTLPIVQSFGAYAFDNCNQIETLIVHSNGSTIGVSAHSTLKSATVYGDLPAGIFNGYTNLSSVTLYDTKTIGQNAFNGCTALTELTLPESVTSIGEKAFSGASALQSLRLPNGLTEIREKTFYGCSALTELTIPDGVTFIGSSAFDQSGLTTVNLPNSLEKAYDDSFTGVSVQTKTENGVTYYGNDNNPYLILVSAITWSTSFETNPETRVIFSTALAENETVQCVVLGENVTFINSGAFNREYVTAVVVNENNAKYEVRDKILYDLSPLEIVFAPKNLSGNITVYAYCDLLLQNCPNLTGVTFADTVTYIHPYALNGSKENITHLAVKNPNVSLGAVQNVRILSGMGKLEYLEMPVSDSLGEYFGINAFDGAVAVKQTYGFVTSGYTTYLASKTYYIPANLKNVVVTKSYGLGSSGSASSGSGNISHWGYFENCTMLQEVTVRGISKLAQSTFFKCSNLTKVTLGADVTTIGAYAFSSCPIQAIYLEGGQAHYNSISFENRFDASDYSGKLVIL